MTFFESLLALLAIAIALLQVSRRLSIPYPTMLAASGVVLALIPGTPTIEFDPQTALALFIAPALFDAAFEFPVGAIRRLWRPLLAVALIAVAITAAAVAWLGVRVAGLPLFAAIALGAIVAPPDAVAATAILGTVRMPQRTVAILKGESLLNDATAILLFSAAVASLQHPTGVDLHLALQIGLAAPGGLLLGVVLAKILSYLLQFFAGLLSASLLEYLFSFGAWILAAHLGLSPVLSVVAFAMTLARTAGRLTPARMRRHYTAVSHTLVFLLNVLAFLLMGFQAKSIITSMAADRLHESAWFAACVVVCVIVVRVIWVVLYNRLAHRFKALRGDLTPSTLRQGVLISWCGMRGLVTLATAIALPATFPQRDLVVLTAFSVVLATLVLQGLTLAPLVRLLKLDGEDGLAAEMGEARAVLSSVAQESLRHEAGIIADHWRLQFHVLGAAEAASVSRDLRTEWRRLGLRALAEQRGRLEKMRNESSVGPEAYAFLQEDLDYGELALTSECARRIEEG